MKNFVLAIWLILCPSYSVSGADPTCSNGITHPEFGNPSCCASFCGDACGAENCEKVSAQSCCGYAIEDANKSCDTNDPPCIINTNSSPSDTEENKTCSGIGGILASDGTSCCSASCGECGGTGCGARPGGASECCTSAIISANLSCNTNSPPCVKQTTESSPESCSDIGGILASDSVSCCPSSCGSCGGFGCELRPGGKEDCCSSEIKSADQSCDTNSPPCTMEAGTTTSSDSVKRYVGVGVYTASQSPQSREEDLGLEIFDYRLIFQKIYSLNFSEIRQAKNEGFMPIMNLEFLSDSDSPVLPKILSGVYDKQLKEFAEECAEGGFTFWIRTLHEFNGNWYPWGILYWYEGKQSNTPADLKSSLQRIVGIFRDANAPVKFQLDINAENGYDDPRPFSYYWPGTEGMDAVTITSYNRAYSTIYHQFSNSFYEGFKNPYDQVSALSNLPIWVAETGTTSYGTDKPTWLRDCFKSIALDFPRVVQVTFFLDNKFQEGKVTDWDLNTEEDKEAFVDGFLTMKSLTS